MRRLKLLIALLVVAFSVTGCSYGIIDIGNPPSPLPIPTEPFAPDNNEGGVLAAAKFWEDNPTWAGSSYVDQTATLYVVQLGVTDAKAEIGTTSFASLLTTGISIDENGVLNSDEFLAGFKLASAEDNGKIRLMVWDETGKIIAKLEPITNPATDDVLKLVDTEASCTESTEKCYDLDGDLGFEFEQYSTAGFVQASTNGDGSCGERFFDFCLEEGKKLAEMVCGGNGTPLEYSLTVVECDCHEGKCQDVLALTETGNELMKQSLQDKNIETKTKLPPLDYNLLLLKPE